jgi:hypothetical protein
MMKIHFHSVVDVITNSSTTIYTRVQDGAVEAVKAIINAILDGLGEELRADDLFEFTINKKFSEGELEWRRDDYMVDKLGLKYESPNQWVALRQTFTEEPWWVDRDALGAEDYENSSIVVRALRPDFTAAARAMDALNNLVGQEEVYS